MSNTQHKSHNNCRKYQNIGHKQSEGKIILPNMSLTEALNGVADNSCPHDSHSARGIMGIKYQLFFFTLNNIEFHILVCQIVNKENY